MSTFQQVIIIGNVSSEVSVNYTPAGAAIANFSLATNKSWKDKNTGQKQEKAEFHRVSVFGKLAEIAGEYVTKGSKLHIVGELETKKWQDKTGADRYTTSILVSGFQGQMTMLGSKQEGQQQNQAPRQTQQVPQQLLNKQSMNPNQMQNLQQPHPKAPPVNYQNQMGQAPQQQAPTGDFDNNFDDDIPFNHAQQSGQ